MPENMLPVIVGIAAWEKVTKGRAGIGRDYVVDKIWNDIGEDQEGVLSTETFGGYKTEKEEIIEEMEKETLRNKVKEKKHLDIYEGLREDIEMKTCLHGPTDYAEKLKLLFRVGDLDLPERTKRYTSRREEEDVATNMRPCGATTERRTHIVGEREKYEEVRDAIEDEMRKLDVCDMERFGRLESSEKTITTLGYRWWPQTAKQDGDKISKQFLCSIPGMEEA